MNNARTLYSRNAFAAAALTLIASVAAVPAYAQQASRAEVRAGAVQALASGELDARMVESYTTVVPAASSRVSTLSRAQVRADAAQAVASGRTDEMVGESYGNVALQRPSSTLSRAEVRAATVQALRDGSVSSQVGESYGTVPVRNVRRAL